MSNIPFPFPGGPDRVSDDPDQPLDTDLDPDQVDSADADEQAAEEGTRGEDA